MAGTINAVVAAWRLGNFASGGSLMTDGDNLWSYALQIGETAGTDYKIAFDIYPRSMTTAKHINMARAVADEVLRFDESIDRV